MNMETRIQEMLQNITNKKELPEGSLYLYNNISSKGKNKGEKISVSLCISEPDYPPNNNKGQKSYVVMNIPNQINTVELLIRNNQFDQIRVPNDAVVKGLKSDKIYKHVMFEPESEELYDYIEENIKYCLDHYESGSNFACCSKYVDCSNASKCLHINKLYAKGCAYRKNLEQGKIFY